MMLGRRSTDTGEQIVRPVSNDSTEAEILQTMNHLLQSQERIEGKLELLFQDRGDKKVSDEKIILIISRLDKIETKSEIAEKQGSTYRWLIGIVITLFAIICGVASTHIVWK